MNVFTDQLCTEKNRVSGHTHLKNTERSHNTCAVNVGLGVFMNMTQTHSFCMPLVCDGTWPAQAS